MSALKIAVILMILMLLLITGALYAKITQVNCNSCLEYTDLVAIFEVNSESSNPFTKLIRKFLSHSNDPSRGLAIIFGLIAVLSESDFVSMAKRLLKEIFFQNRNENPFVSLLMSFCLRQWSSRISNCPNESLILEIISDDSLEPIIEFIFRKQGDAIDALREAVMDTYELIIGLFLNYSAITETGGVPPLLESLLTRVAQQPLWMRNTLLLIQRFFAAVLRGVKILTSRMAVDWLLSAGFSLSSSSIGTPKVQESERRSFELACTLISASEDVALAQSAGEVYALFANHFPPEENDALCMWLYALTWMSNQLQGISWAFLDKVFSLSPLVPSMLIEKFSLSFTEGGLSTLLHAYRYRLTKKGLKRSPLAPPNLALILRGFRSQDYQLNQQSLGVIELLLCQASLNDTGLINLFIEAVDIGTCWFDQGARSRMCIAITRVIGYFISLIDKEKNSKKRVELVIQMRKVFSRIAEVILSHLHFGGISMRVTNALAFLIAVYIWDSESPSSNVRASISSSHRYFPFDDQEMILVEWSSERSVDLITLAGASIDRIHWKEPDCLLRFWRQALTEVARNPRPDVNVVGGHLVRCLLTAPPLPKSQSSVSLVDHLLDVPDPRYRAVATAHYLLDILDSQLRVAEADKGGLLVVSVSGPFYPLLSILRTLLDPECCLPPEWFFKNPPLESLPKVSIYERVLAVVPRVARICSFVIFHSSPEGVLLMVDEDGEHTKILPSGAGEGNQWRNSEDFAALVAASRKNVDVGDESESEPEVANALRRVIERPEHLVVNCWRSVREIALLLGGSLTRDALLATPRIPVLSVGQPKIEKVVGRKSLGWEITLEFGFSEIEVSMLCSRLFEQVELCASALSLTEEARDESCPQDIDLLQVMADFFISQLIRSRHPGAFELTASGFQSFCEILLKSNDYEDVSQWPEQWLSVVIADLTNSTILPITTEIGNLPMKYLQDTALCATRRSAGLPFFVQALLVVLHKTNRSGDLLNRTVKVLLAEVNRGAEATTVPSACKGQTSLSAAERRLHAMNVLKALVHDATVGPLICGDHLEAILICSFQGLDSSYWMLQNAGLMLYSAMMERIFGVNRTRDCESKKNRMTSSVFFAKFPGLRDYLLKALEEAIGELKPVQSCAKELTSDKGDAWQTLELSLALATTSPYVGKTKLFSLLNLLKRLLPPIQQATTDGILVHAFVPLVFRCAGASDIRIRLLGAKALVSLLHPASLPHMAYRLLLDISPSLFSSSSSDISEPRLGTNLVHGMLLQVLEIMKSEYWPVYDASALQNGPHSKHLTGITVILSQLASTCFDPSSNLCPIIRQTCLACYLAFSPSTALPFAKIRSHDAPSSPGALDVATTELLVHLQDAFKNKNLSLDVLVKQVLSGSNLELKRLTLGLLVMYINGNVDFSKCGRLLWYEDVVNLLSGVSSSPYRFITHGRRLDISFSVPQLFEAIATSQDRSYQPYSLIGFHASQLLAYLTITASSDRTWADRVPALTSQIPKHLAPLLTVNALTSIDKDRVLDLLAGFVDLKNPEIHWSIRAEALLAVYRLLSQDKASLIHNLSINLAVLKSLVLETDKEVLVIAATTACKILPEADCYPQKPLPPVILPQFLSNLISVFGEAAITSLLDWLQEDLLLTKEDDGSEVLSRVFVSEESTASTSVVELTTLFCLTIRKWVQIASSTERSAFVVGELCRRDLIEPSGGTLSEMGFSRISKIAALRRTESEEFWRWIVGGRWLDLISHSGANNSV
ncbi:hypothetical protein Aperf_G00000128958 [Anoplocephala perfoliata]